MLAVSPNILADYADIANKVRDGTEYIEERLIVYETLSVAQTLLVANSFGAIGSVYESADRQREPQVHDAVTTRWAVEPESWEFGEGDWDK